MGSDHAPPLTTMSSGFPKARIVEQPIEVEEQDGAKCTSVYRTERRILYVRADNGKNSPPVEIGMSDEIRLAKTVLLEPYGYFKMAWKGWKPAGCEHIDRVKLFSGSGSLTPR